VVRTADGGLAVGRALPGRGAWLCEGEPACVDQAERRKAFSRALRGQVEGGAVAGLRARLEERARMEGFGSPSRRED
jgi:predicted RNA-binding protein YlxR (DUF448 family)